MQALLNPKEIRYASLEMLRRKIKSKKAQKDCKFNKTVVLFKILDVYTKTHPKLNRMRLNVQQTIFKKGGDKVNKHLNSMTCDNVIQPCISVLQFRM